MATHARDLTTVPLRTQPDTFSDDMEWLLSNLQGWTGEVNDIADEAETNANTAETQAGIATAQASAASASATDAANSAITSASSASATLWVSGVSVDQWAVKISPANGQSYRKITATGSTTTDPANDATNYTPVSTTGGITRAARTSNTQLVRANWRNLIDITSGTFTQTFAACSALGAGWWCIIRNTGSGDITLDPNGSETIDGLTSFIMYPGEARLIQCDGSALRSIVLASFYRVFESSGTFTKPPGYTRFAGQLWGAGGSGRKHSTASIKSGGGGGACALFDLLASLVGATVTVTIGDGGAAVSTDATNGNDGGNSSFGSFVTAYGGKGGINSTAYGGNAYLSNALNNIIIGGDQLGGPYLGGCQATSASDQSCVYGGAAGGSITAADVLRTSTSIFGGASGAASLASSGSAGTAPGGGGGATKTGTSSGAGARGELRIWGVV